MLSFQKITIENGDEITLRLREDAQAVEQKSGEGVLDVNPFGNWVRGLELIGGFVEFPLHSAVRPFDPVKPDPLSPSMPGTVTYDEEADASYFHLFYGPAILALAKEEQAQLTKIQGSIANPHCLFGLDSEGGLVWVRIPLADLTTPPETFVRLLKTE